MAEQNGEKLWNNAIILKEDPNAQKNRIPTAAELSWPAQTAKGLSRSISVMKEDIEMSQTAHEMLMASYQRQLQELEGTQSQLHGSERLLKLKKKQCIALQSELKRVADIRHPVRRLPSDVLQCIFEATCGINDKSNKGQKLITAIYLSHVCRRWRTIATDSPRIWSAIDLSLTRKRSVISTIMGFILPRIKYVPAEIRLSHLNAETGPQLKSCNLQRIPVLERLRLDLDDTEYFHELHKMANLLPKTGIQKLHITDSSSVPDDDDDAPLPIFWDLGDLVANMPAIASLRLHSTRCAFRVTPSVKLERITSLILSNLKEVDILLLLSLLTQIEHLDILGGTLTENEQLEMVSSPVQALSMLRCDGDDSLLHYLSCPNLTAFHSDAPDPSDNRVSFAQNHQSITTLSILGCSDAVAKLAIAAPHVQSLSVSAGFSQLYKRKLPRVKGHPFPCLSSLSIDLVDKELSLVDFEGIVGGRCLPKSHPQSKLAPSLTPLRTLTILRVRAGGLPELWRNSELFQSASKSVQPDAFWPDEERLILSWD